MDWKFWYGIKERIDHYDNQNHILEDTMYLPYRFVDYLLLNRVMNTVKPKKIGWIGGFSNLDFFIPQYGVDSIKECTNVDGCPANRWLSEKHEQYKKQFGYTGKYTFHNDWYDNKYFNDIDFLFSSTIMHDPIDPKILEKVHTLIFDHHSNPIHFDRIKEHSNGLTRRVLTENFAVYTSKDCNELFNEIKSFVKVIKSLFRYRPISESTWKAFTEDVDTSTVAECSIFQSTIDWDDRIKTIMDTQRK